MNYGYIIGFLTGVIVGVILLDYIIRSQKVNDAKDSKIIGMKCSCGQLFKGDIRISLNLLADHYLEIHKNQVDENGKGYMQFSVVIDCE